MVAQDLIEAARDYHADFFKNDFPNRVLLRQLAMLEKRIAQQVTALDEEALATSKSFVKAYVDTALATGKGIILPPHFLVLDAVYRGSDGRKPIIFLTYRQRHESSHFPAATILGQKLVPVDLRDGGSSTSGWENMTELLVRYVPIPAALESLDQELTLPDLAEEALVKNLALFMAIRGNILPELPGLVEEASEAEQTCIATLAGQDMTTTWTVRKVY